MHEYPVSKRVRIIVCLLKSENQGCYYAFKDEVCELVMPNRRLGIPQKYMNISDSSFVNKNLCY
jgi:hypothetical protein